MTYTTVKSRSDPYLYTEDYLEIGKMIRKNRKDHVFAALEGGYNHSVIGRNAIALFKGLCNF